MTKSKFFSVILMALSVMSCSDIEKETVNKTPEAEEMLDKLRDISAEKKFMFGHHDDPVYGIGWDGDENRSDVKSVCGDYPAIMSFDLGRMEIFGDKTLDNVPLDRIRKEVIAQYERGGMSSFSWHVDNPLTGKDSWDVSDSTVVKSENISDETRVKEKKDEQRPKDQGYMSYRKKNKKRASNNIDNEESNIIEIEEVSATEQTKGSRIDLLG